MNETAAYSLHVRLITFMWLQFKQVWLRIRLLVIRGPKQQPSKLPSRIRQNGAAPGILPSLAEKYPGGNSLNGHYDYLVQLIIVNKTIL